MLRYVHRAGVGVVAWRQGGSAFVAATLAPRDAHRRIVSRGRVVRLISPAAAGGGAITGTGSNTIAAFTTAGTGTVAIAGIGSNTVAAFTSAGTGQIPITGSGANTVTQVGSGSGAVAITGSGTATLSAFSSAASGYVQSGSYSITAARANLIYEIALLHGLDPAKPLVVSPASRSAGGLLQTVSGTSTVTITTQASEVLTGNLDDWIDALAAIHGLTTPLVVTATGRTAGAITETFETVGQTTTVTRV